MEVTNGYCKSCIALVTPTTANTCPLCALAVEVFVDGKGFVKAKDLEQEVQELGTIDDNCTLEIIGKL